MLKQLLHKIHQAGSLFCRANPVEPNSSEAYLLHLREFEERAGSTWSSATASTNDPESGFGYLAACSRRSLGGQP